MTQPAPPPAQRINPTRPEHLAASSKRQSKFHLLQLYRQLLPVLPAKQSFSTSLHSALGHSLETLPIQAEWDHFSASIWVHRESDMVRLWRQGFFGKGLLSRSEPSWKRRVENRRAEVDGTQKRLTSEEITAARRLERKGVKLVKKAERDAERLQAASAAVSVAGSVPPSPALSSSSGTPLPGLPEELEARLEGIAEEREADAEGRGEKDGHEDEEEDEDKDVPPELWQLDVEHTQLQPEEAFFLLFSLGCLSLTVPPSPFDPPPAAASASPSSSSTHSRPLSILSALRLFLLSAVPTLPPTLDLKPDTDPRLNRLDNPFFLQYAAYHHYRSMGWVIRSGVKFCTDWVLYGPGGPVGGHAEFAVIVLPSYVDPRDSLSNPFRSNSAYLAIDSDADARQAFAEASAFETGNGSGSGEGEREAGYGAEEYRMGEGERKSSWRWFHTVTRVISGVKKTLVLLHVVIPPLSSLPQEPNWVANNPAQALAKLEMREVVMRRFIAGRMRD